MHERCPFSFTFLDANCPNDPPRRKKQRHMHIYNYAAAAAATTDLHSLPMNQSSSEPNEPNEPTNEPNEFQDEFPLSGETTDSRRNHGDAFGNIPISVGSDQACSYPFFFCLLLLAIIILGVTLGVTLPVQDQSPTVTVVASTSAPIAGSGPTIASPVATPTLAPQTKPPAEFTREEFLRSKVLVWSGSDVDQVGTPAHLAFGWLTTIDPKDLGKDSSERDIRQRYIAALIYFSTQGQFWQAQRRKLQDMPTIFGFLSGDDVCNWNQDDTGIFCNGNGSIEIIQLCKCVVLYMLRRHIRHINR